MRFFIKTLLISFVPLSVYSQEIVESEIDSVFSTWNQENGPGGVVGIFSNGELLFVKGYGLANLGDKVLNSSNTKFYIASMSKQFTAACIINLIQEEKLNIEESIDKFFPNFPEYIKEVKIKHLLNHTSGLRDYMGRLSWLKFRVESWQDNHTNAEILKLLSMQQSLIFKPGEKFLYSNTNYFLLGQIVEKVTGMSLAEYQKELIFEPLAMNNTLVYSETDQIVTNRALPYTRSGKESYKLHDHLQTQTGATGIYSTIEDMKKWDDEFYNRKIFDDEFWNYMTQRGILWSGDTIKYASGLEVENYRGVPTVHHAGGLVGYGSHMVRFPNQHLTIIAISNFAQSRPYDKVYEIADLLLKDEFQDNTTTNEQPEIYEIKNISPKNVRKFVGSYWVEEAGRFFEFVAKNDTLCIAFNKDNPTPLEYVGNEVFIKTNRLNARIEFDISNLDSVTFYWTSYDPNRPFMNANGEKLLKIDLTSELIEEYQGKYYCAELDVIYEFIKVGNGIELWSNGRKSSWLEFITKDRFVENRVNYQFIRNSDNSIKGFNITTPSKYTLKFEKI